MSRIWELPGGVHPPENKHQSLSQPIGTLPLPEKLVIPLNQHIGAPATPIVAVNDRVRKGQMLAEANGAVSAAVHAPTSGTIVAIDDQPIPHPSGMSSPCITLIPDGKDTWIELEPIADYHKIPPPALLEVIRNAGIAGMGGAGFPTAIKLQPRHPIDTLIINATECEPYITADDSLIREQAPAIVAGINILRHILGDPARVVIGIEDNKPEAYQALQQQLPGTGIELVEFPTKYPSGGEKQLIYILTGREVPSSGLPADIGIVCQNIGTTYAIHQAVCHGIPLISRITTVTGKALESNRNYQVLIGTPISHLLKHNGYRADNCVRLIMGGPMMGFTLTDPEVPVIKTTNCILAPSHAELPLPPPAQACIRCGLCAEACPVSLLPQQLYWYARSQNHDKLEAYSLFDCIECGACSYVCPSNIPLVQYYRAAKGEIRLEKLERAKSDRARERFEAQKQRKEKAEAEKAAKREARRLAAEQAKATTANAATKEADDLIKAALVRAQERQNHPEQQLDRQQRAVRSAEERVLLAEQKLAEVTSSGTPEQIEQARAKLEDTRHRLQQAQTKLAELQVADKAEAVAKKVNASPKVVLEQKINAIKTRLASIESKLNETTDPTVREALLGNLQKQQQKLAEAHDQLAEVADAPAAQTLSDDDAATAAIVRAQAKATARLGMSARDKLQDTLTSLQGRLTKAEQRLAAAEQEQSEQAEALRAGVEKLRAKLAETEAQLAELGDP